jgi:hypothetical protein
MTRPWLLPIVSRVQLHTQLCRGFNTSLANEPGSPRRRASCPVCHRRLPRPRSAARQADGGLRRTFARNSSRSLCPSASVTPWREPLATRQALTSPSRISRTVVATIEYRACPGGRSLPIPNPVPAQSTAGCRRRRCVTGHRPGVLRARGDALIVGNDAVGDWHVIAQRPGDAG